jgi:hypothetical protein
MLTDKEAGWGNVCAVDICAALVDTRDVLILIYH